MFETYSVPKKAVTTPEKPHSPKMALVKLAPLDPGRAPFLAPWAAGSFREVAWSPFCSLDKLAELRGAAARQAPLDRE